MVGGEVHFPVLEVTDVPLSSVLRYIQVEANKMLPDGAKLSVVVHIIGEGRELLFPVCDVITLTEGGDNSASRLTFYMEDAGLTEILSEISSRTGMKYMFVKNRIDVKHPAFVSRAEVDQKFNGKSR